MRKCPWEEIHGYGGFIEFDRFINWMSEQVSAHISKEIPVDAPYLGGNTLREKWFLHLESGEIWRLVWPDAPFAGVFELVHAAEASEGM